MKFLQQFESNKLYVCAKFRGNESRDFGFKTRKPPQKFGVKNGFIEKRLECSKKYFAELLYVLRYPSIRTNPLLATMSFFFFFLFLLYKSCALFS